MSLRREKASWGLPLKSQAGLKELQKQRRYSDQMARGIHHSHQQLHQQQLAAAQQSYQQQLQNAARTQSLTRRNQLAQKQAHKIVRNGHPPPSHTHSQTFTDGFTNGNGFTKALNKPNYSNSVHLNGGNSQHHTSQHHRDGYSSAPMNNGLANPNLSFARHSHPKHDINDPEEGLAEEELEAGIYVDRDEPFDVRPPTSMDSEEFNVFQNGSPTKPPPLTDTKNSSITSSVTGGHSVAGGSAASAVGVDSNGKIASFGATAPSGFGKFNKLPKTNTVDHSVTRGSEANLNFGLGPPGSFASNGGTPGKPHSIEPKGHSQSQIFHHKQTPAHNARAHNPAHNTSQCHNTSQQHNVSHHNLSTESSLSLLEGLAKDPRLKCQKFASIPGRRNSNSQNIDLEDGMLLTSTKLENPFRPETNGAGAKGNSTQNKSNSMMDAYIAERYRAMRDPNHHHSQERIDQELQHLEQGKQLVAQQLVQQIQSATLAGLQSGIQPSTAHGPHSEGQSGPHQSGVHVSMANGHPHNSGGFLKDGDFEVNPVYENLNVNHGNTYLHGSPLAEDGTNGASSPGGPARTSNGRSPRRKQGSQGVNFSNSANDGGGIDSSTTPDDGTDGGFGGGNPKRNTSTLSIGGQSVATSVADALPAMSNTGTNFFPGRNPKKQANRARPVVGGSISTRPRPGTIGGYVAGKVLGAGGKAGQNNESSDGEIVSLFPGTGTHYTHVGRVHCERPDTTLGNMTQNYREPISTGGRSGSHTSLNSTTRPNTVMNGESSAANTVECSDSESLDTLGRMDPIGRHTFTEGFCRDGRLSSSQQSIRTLRGPGTPSLAGHSVERHLPGATNRSHNFMINTNENLKVSNYTNLAIQRPKSQEVGNAMNRSMSNAKLQDRKLQDRAVQRFAPMQISQCKGKNVVVVGKTSIGSQCNIINPRVATNLPSPPPILQKKKTLTRSTNGDGDGMNDDFNSNMVSTWMKPRQRKPMRFEKLMQNSFSIEPVEVKKPTTIDSGVNTSNKTMEANAGAQTLESGDTTGELNSKINTMRREKQQLEARLYKLEQELLSDQDRLKAREEKFSEELLSELKDNLKILVSAPMVSVQLGQSYGSLNVSNEFPFQKIEESVRKDILPKYTQILMAHSDSGKKFLTVSKKTVEDYVSEMCGTIVDHITTKVEKLIPIAKVTVVNDY